MLKIISCLFCFLFSLSLNAKESQLNYEMTLEARSGQFNAYRLDSPSVIYNSSPVIDHQGRIAFVYLALDDRSQEFRYRVRWQTKTGEDIDVYQAQADFYLSSVKTSFEGDLLFTESNSAETYEVHQWMAKNRQLIRPFDLSDFPKTLSFSALSFAEKKASRYVWRNLDQFGERSLLSTHQESTTILKEGEGEVAYIFTPKSNANFLAAKVRRGESRQWDESRPDQILRWQGPYKQSRVIAQDRDALAISPYLSFQNSLGVSSKGAVVFVATRDLPGKPKGVYLWTPATLVAPEKTTEVALEGKADLSQIEMFAPVVNKNNVVVFRAIDQALKRSVFVWSKETGLHKIISEGDIVPSDVETARIIDTDWGPGLAGAPSLNDQNQFVFQAILESKKGERRLGSAIYKVNLKL